MSKALSAFINAICNFLVEQKVQWISQLLVPDPAHGLLSQLSRTHTVSRQTLYRWKEKGAQALQAALEISQAHPKGTLQVQEHVLRLLIEAYASYRDIQACLLKLSGRRISLGSITKIFVELTDFDGGHKVGIPAQTCAFCLTMIRVPHLAGRASIWLSLLTLGGVRLLFPSSEKLRQAHQKHELDRLVQSLVSR